MRKEKVNTGIGWYRATSMLVMIAAIIFVILVVPLRNSFEKPVPVPGSCLVLQEKYCRAVKLIDTTRGTIAAFELPSGTPVFSPYTGAITADDDLIDIQFSPSLVMVWEDETQNYFMIQHTGELEFVVKNHINKGEVLLRVGEISLEGRIGFDPNLILTFIRDGRTIDVSMFDIS